MIEVIEQPVKPTTAEIEDNAPVKRQLPTRDGALQDDPPKPLLRGWIHAAAAFAALVILIVFLVKSEPIDRSLSVIIFGISLVELFGVSAAFHILRWRGRLHLSMRLLDHSSIFVMTAATATAFALTAPLTPVRLVLIGLCWVAAAGGIATKALYRGMSRTLGTCLYLAMGWVCGGAWLALWLLPVAATPTRLTMSAPLLPLTLAGTMYTLGAAIYLRRAPNWWPAVFGYHELFHVLVVLASASIMIAVLQATGMLVGFLP